MAPSPPGPGVDSPSGKVLVGSAAQWVEY